MRQIFAITAVVLALMAWVPLAAAADSLGYDGAAGAVQSEVERSDRGSSLPFTGLDVGLLIGGGVLLLMLGGGLRRLTREKA